ncbi:MAG: 50S ribosomal protein L9 [Hyphomicrobiales bacterium]
MEIILLERVAKLGQMGEIVRVKDGYARNFLLPTGKALRATEANKQKFEGQRVELEARNLERKKEAEEVGSKLNGFTFPVIRSAGETGQLYGSVSARDIADSLNEAGYSVSRAQVTMEQPIKTIGMHVVPITLHPEVDITVTTNIARSPDEATRQAAGEDLSQREEIELDLEVFDGEMDEFFEEGARSDDDDAEDTDATSEAEAETADDSEKE